MVGSGASAGPAVQRHSVIQHMGILDYFKHRRRGDDVRLHGTWVLERTEDPSMDVGQGVKMEFFPDGRLTYSIRQGTTRQIMKLVYHVAGSEIVSNQPSAPAESRTRYEITGAGQLVLEFEGARSWYSRQTGSAG